jgi:hypothetical protein
LKEPPRNFADGKARHERELSRDGTVNATIQHATDRPCLNATRRSNLIWNDRQVGRIPVTDRRGSK